ncbi:MAG: hypothetical protein KJZ72_21160 [Anaerolineales bacterium]|nr:hypothetical protein [Anaerolineales bacterium]
MRPGFVHADLENPIYVAWKRFLHDSDEWSQEEIAEYQVREIQRIVRRAYETTQGYRDLFDLHGLKPDMLQSLADMHKFPFVEKEMIRDRLDEYSTTFAGRTYVTTGGSTGIPFGMYRDPEAFPKELASKAHQYQRIGWQEGDRQIVFRGLPIETPDHMAFEVAFNELRCSSYHLLPPQMEVYRQQAFIFRPDWIRCYPSSGYVFSQWLLEKGVLFPPVKGILCASENLYDFQKEALGRAFPGARVFSHYGHYELAVLAGYCEYTDDYHVLPQYGYAELIDSQGCTVTTPGQVGEIVGTSFIMHATPFIRYRTRDYAVFKGWGCPACGRPYQVWRRIEGRLQEFVLTDSGRLISMTAVNFHDNIFDHIRQFQFYQKEKGQLKFRYIPKSTCNEVILQSIHQRLLSKLGSDIALQLEQVDNIPLTSRGKHRFLIQDLPIQFHDEGNTVWDVDGQLHEEITHE